MPSSAFQIASRLRTQIPEFRSVTDEMFVDVVSGGEAPAAVRGRQRILALLLQRRGCERVGKLIEARKVELRQRQEIKTNTDDATRKAHEHSFNALFVQLTVIELEGMGYVEWVRSRSEEGWVPSPPAKEWFVEAVAFLLGEKAGAKPTVDKKILLSKEDSMKLARSSLHATSESPAPSVTSRAAEPSSRASSAVDQRKVSSILKVASNNLKLESPSPLSEIAPQKGQSLVLELESQLRDARQECSLLREEVAKMQDLVAEKLLLDDSSPKRKAMDPRAVEFLKAQQLQMMRHVFEMRELLLNK